MPSNADRIRTIVDLGTETRYTNGGWQLDNIRIGVYPDGHWVFASLDRDIGNPVVHARTREGMHRLLDQVMDEMEQKVTHGRSRLLHRTSGGNELWIHD